MHLVVHLVIWFFKLLRIAAVRRFLALMFFGVLGLLGLSISMDARRLDQQGISAVATVTRLEVSSRGNPGREVIKYQPVIQFQTPDGQTIEALTGMPLRNPSARVGEEFIVTYLPDNPQNFRRKDAAMSSTSSYLFTAICGFIALLNLRWLVRGFSGVTTKTPAKNSQGGFKQASAAWQKALPHSDAKQAALAALAGQIKHVADTTTPPKAPHTPGQSPVTAPLPSKTVSGPTRPTGTISKPKWWER
jgi:Protein of unknown function (DUF3592)